MGAGRRGEIAVGGLLWLAARTPDWQMSMPKQRVWQEEEGRESFELPSVLLLVAMLSLGSLRRRCTLRLILLALHLTARSLAPSSDTTSLKFLDELLQLRRDDSVRTALQQITIEDTHQQCTRDESTNSELT